MRAFSTLRILPRIGRIAWYCGLRPDLAEPPAESPSTMKISHFVGSFGLAVGQLARQRRRLQQPLAARQVARLAGRDARLGRLGCALRMMSAASFGLRSSQSVRCSWTTFWTKVFASVLPSLVLVWPSNCGSPA